jgi:hypothetical protein
MVSACVEDVTAVNRKPERGWGPTVTSKGIPLNDLWDLSSDSISLSLSLSLSHTHTHTHTHTQIIIIIILQY